MYELISKNLSGLGGPMGTEETWDNWREFFLDPEKAKAYAQADYTRGKLKWTPTKYGWRTNDLGYVRYYLTKVEALDQPKETQ